MPCSGEDSAHGSVLVTGRYEEGNVGLMVTEALEGKIPTWPAFVATAISRFPNVGVTGPAAVGQEGSSPHSEPTTFHVTFQGGQEGPETGWRR